MSKLKANKELLKGSGATMVLTILRHRDLYGYQIVKELEKISDGVFTLTEGSLYPLLHKLESDGAVESYWVDEDESRKRKYYSITRQGRAVLKERSREWDAFKTAVEKVLSTAKRAGAV